MRTIEPQELKDIHNLSYIRKHTLQQLAERIKFQDIKISTYKTYKTYWFRYINFNLQYKNAFPPNKDNVEQFLVYLFLKISSDKNCKRCLIALRKLFIVADVKDSSDHNTTRLLNGLNNISSVSFELERLPWKISFIRQWITSSSKFQTYEFYVLSTLVMILGLRLLLRGTELATIMNEDISGFSQNGKNGLKLRIRSTKVDRFRRRKGKTLFLEKTGSDICPVKWFDKWCKVKPIGRYLFSGEVLWNYKNITEILRVVASTLQLESNYSSHSLRIGGATEAHLAGFSEATISGMEDWSRPSIHLYLRSCLHSDRNLSKEMGF
ncbi:hypothetical protein ABK040_016389 [Willaertia magna]